MDMDIEWQVCELEDSRKSFIEYSVAAVPETWIFKRDNVWWCYWPKFNVLKKIKSCEEPNPNDGKWAAFKCRILMNGEKFQTYMEAVEAEKIGQNFSILESQAENEVGESICDSTMDFEVSCFTDEECDMNEEDIVGNDSYEYNKVTAKGYYFYAKNAVISQDAQFNLITSEEETAESSDAGDLNVSAKCDQAKYDNNNQLKSYESETSSEANSEISEKSDYSIQFKANASSILTSTLLGAEESVPMSDNLPTFGNERFLSKASEIETKVSSFLKSIQKDFHDLKEIAKLNMYKQVPKSPAILLDPVNGNVEKSFSKRGSYAAFNETFSLCGLPDALKNNDIQFDENKKTACDRTACNGVFNDTYSLSGLPAPLENNDIQVDEHNKPASDRNENDMNNTHDSQLTGENIRVDISISSTLVNATEESTENVIVNAPLLQEIDPVPQKNPPLPQENHDENIEPNDENFNRAVHLPLREIDEWKPTEELLEEAVLEEALIEHLSPFNDEDETAYFNRSIGILFSNDFLIDYVTWKPEKGRALIKNSHILYCWKESHGKKFPMDDIDNKRFKDNIRRVKSAKRAARKTQEKKKLNRIGKQTRQ